MGSWKSCSATIHNWHSDFAQQTQQFSRPKHRPCRCFKRWRRRRSLRGWQFRCRCKSRKHCSSESSLLSEEFHTTHSQWASRRFQHRLPRKAQHRRNRRKRPRQTSRMATETAAGMTIGGTALHSAIGGTGAATTLAGGAGDAHQSPPRGRQAQPRWRDATEAAQHVDVQADGWQWSSYQLDEQILRSTRGPPYYKSRKTGKFLRAIQCTATQCNNMQPPCNFSIRGPEDDHHTGHLCSYCRQELEWRRAQQRAHQDDPDDPRAARIAPR